MDAVLWTARSGARWHDLPKHLDRVDAVKRRDYRWIERGVLDMFLGALAHEADLQRVMIVSTIARASARRRR